jgi:hypothetical protein
MLGLAALSGWIALTETPPRGPPALFFVWSSVLLIWTALELRRLTQRIASMESR